MITIFNRKELITTYEMKEQARIRTVLSQNGIDYKISTVNRKSPSPAASGSRARTGTLGENLNLAYEYKFFVKKEDIEKAKEIIYG